MEETELQQRLATVEQQISEDKELIARQRKLLTDLEAKEADNTSVLIMLACLENLLAFHMKERERLARD